MSITSEQLRRVAALARLRLDDEETQALAADLGRILDYVDKLGELDTASVEPTSHVVAVESPWREDVVTRPNGEEAANEAVANAPRASGQFFAVPPILE